MYFAVFHTDSFMYIDLIMFVCNHSHSHSCRPILVACKPKITLTGLTGSATHTSLLLIREDGDEGVLSRTGQWNLSDSSLVIALSSNMKKNTELVFSFSLHNRAAPQASPSISIKVGSSTKDFISVEVMDRDGSSTPQPSAVINTQVGDAQPMTIWAIRFVQKSIGQTTP